MCDEAFDVTDSTVTRSECAVEEKKTKQRMDHLLLSQLQLDSIIDVILIQFDEFQRVRPQKRPIRSKPGSFFPQEVSSANNAGT